MGIFSKITQLFKSNQPHHELLDSYALIHSLSKNVQKQLRILRLMHKQLVQAKRASVLGEKTGKLGLEKTLFIEEELVPKLRILAQSAETRFVQAYEEVSKLQPTSVLEREEARRIIKFLQEVQSLLPEISTLSSIRPEQRLLVVETVLREVTNLSRKFHDVEKYEQELARKVLAHEISPLLKKMYSSPNYYALEGRSSPSLLTFTVSNRQLRQLEQEAARINQCQDPNYQIFWQKWWADIQIAKKDRATPLRDPHINVTLKLFGGKKKDIHLLLRD